MGTLIVYNYQSRDKRFDALARRSLADQFSYLPINWLSILPGNVINEDVQIGRAIRGRDISFVIIFRRVEFGTGWIILLNFAVYTISNESIGSMVQTIIPRPEKIKRKATVENSLFVLKDLVLT